LEGSYHGLCEAMSSHLLRGSEHTHRRCEETLGVPAEIKNRHVPNVHYHYLPITQFNKIIILHTLIYIFRQLTGRQGSSELNDNIP